MSRAAVLPLLALLLAGCNGGGLTDGVVCPAVLVPSLEVAVLDAATGASLVPGATGSWVSGDEAGTLEEVDFAARFLTAYGPAGRYRVTVRHPGYLAWERADVRVNRGTCGPETVVLNAALARDPAVAP